MPRRKQVELPLSWWYIFPFFRPPKVWYDNDQEDNGTVGKADHILGTLRTCRRSLRWLLLLQPQRQWPLPKLGRLKRHQAHRPILLARQQPAIRRMPLKMIPHRQPRNTRRSRRTRTSLPQLRKTPPNPQSRSSLMRKPACQPKNNRRKEATRQPDARRLQNAI